MDGKYKLLDVWSKKDYRKTDKLNFQVQSHETLVFKLSR
ncbi:hypothetical protein V5739_00930 [Salinimicrobium sp. TIG7-5_MAKvit]